MTASIRLSADISPGLAAVPREQERRSGQNSRKNGLLSPSQ